MAIEKFDGLESYTDAVRVCFSNGFNMIDTRITPVYCIACSKCLPDLYVHRGSRYGFVGTVRCDNCGENISVTDNDNYVHTTYNIIERVDGQVKRFTLNYDRLYMLNKPIYQLIKDKYDYSIMDRYNEFTDLYVVISDLCEYLNIDFKDINTNQLYVDNNIKNMPDIITLWLNLLTKLDIE